MCDSCSVIMPLLCQIFLSSNKEAHKHLARGGKKKDTLVILVPEHLLPDARAQVFRHCLNINFRQDYRVHDDILALLHDNVKLGDTQRRSMKQIFVTSFNQFKKALTCKFHCCGYYQLLHVMHFIFAYRKRIILLLFLNEHTDDKICKKIRPHREHILIVADEVDDFLGTSLLCLRSFPP